MTVPGATHPAPSAASTASAPGPFLSAWLGSHSERHMMHRILTAAATVVAAAIVLAGCAASGTDEGGGSANGTLRLGLFVQPTSFEAKTANWGNESPYIQAVYDTLLISDTEGQPLPHLATEWS